MTLGTLGTLQALYYLPSAPTGGDRWFALSIFAINREDTHRRQAALLWGAKAPVVASNAVVSRCRCEISKQALYFALSIFAINREDNQRSL